MTAGARTPLACDVRTIAPDSSSTRPVQTSSSAIRQTPNSANGHRSVGFPLSVFGTVSSAAPVLSRDRIRCTPSFVRRRRKRYTALRISGNYHVRFHDGENLCERVGAITRGDFEFRLIITVWRTRRGGPKATECRQYIKLLGRNYRFFCIYYLFFHVVVYTHNYIYIQCTPPLARRPLRIQPGVAVLK